MFPIFGVILGAIWGWTVAGRRGGNRLDKAQYAGGFGIAGGIVGLIAAIIVTRMSLG
ncbi:MAG: hypothetical protein AAFV27_05785 [Pseudomonadota bacterium]